MIRKFIANEFGATAIEYGRIAVAFMTVVQVSAPS
jgi:Flp pilus assembly pilin Flp